MLRRVSSPSLPVVSASSPPHADEGHWLVPRADLARYENATPRRAGIDRMVWAIAEAMFCTDEGPPDAPRLAWLCDDLRDFLHHAGPRARWTVVLALICTFWLSPLLLGHAPPLDRLPPRERAKALDGFEHGSLLTSAAMLAIKALLCILYFEHPDTAARVGFDPRCKTGATP